MTILTWCNDCGEDMNIHGGIECRYCGEEYCLACITEHERYCPENQNQEDELIQPKEVK